jgi:two-component system, LytTR family, sensor kinase
MFKLNRIYTVLFHICFWAVLFLCVVVWRPRNPEMSGGPVPTVQIIGSGICFIIFFYLHSYLLIPFYLFRNKKVTYLLSLLAVFVVVTAVPALIFSLIEHPAGARGPSIGRRIFPALFLLMASASLGLYRENFRLEKNRKVKETEHLRTELSFLRSQVNPHFMLNVLNSMALLARRKSDLLEPVLMELAALMNYMLYDVHNEKISLEDEIKYLQSYIDLQLLRFGDDVAVRFRTPQGIGHRYIEPMLLIPLVENAFKHGIGLVDNPEIVIDIRPAETDRLSMTVSNKYNPLIREQDNRPPGIGLKNLTKRLELIYPGQFELQVGNNYHLDAVVMENWFITTLKIPLQ